MFYFCFTFTCSYISAYVNITSGKWSLKQCFSDCLQSHNKENVDSITGRFSQHQKPAPDAGRREVVMLSTRDRCGDGTRPDVVVPDRRTVGVGGRSENVMKRKTLRRCHDGGVSVSESFTESEATEDGTQSVGINFKLNFKLLLSFFV